MADKLPSRVALPYASDYTEKIQFEPLQMPLGLDQERIQINLRAINTVRMAGGLGYLTIRAADLKPDVTAAGLSVNGAGAASIVGMLGGDQDPISVGKTDRGITEEDIKENFVLDETVEEPDTFLTINTVARENFISKQGKPNAMLDAHLQARFLNQALRAGLLSSVLHANVSWPKARRAASNYAPFVMVEVLGGAPLGPALAVDLAYRPLMVYGIAAAVLLSNAAGTREKLKEAEISTWEFMATYFRHSMFVGVHLDRYLAGVSVARMRKFAHYQP